MVAETAAPRYGDPGFLAAWGAAWSCGDPAALFPLLTPEGCRYRDVGSDLEFVGHEEIARFYRFMLVFAPDSLITFDTAYGDEHGFAAHWTWSGTAAAPLRVGAELFPATGARFSVPGVAFCTLDADGLIASHEDYYDMYAVIKQIREA